MIEFYSRQEPVYIVGDVNIRLDRPDDLRAQLLCMVIKCYGLPLHGPTRRNVARNLLPLPQRHWPPYLRSS